MVRKEIERCLIEQSFVEDLCACFNIVALSYWHKWPPLEELGLKLSRNVVKNSIGFSELEKMDVFPSSESVLAFLRYYKRYHFLVPDVMTPYGKLPKTVEETVVWNIERRVAMLLGRPPLTLHEEAELLSRKSFSDSKKKRSSSCYSCSAASVVAQGHACSKGAMSPLAREASEKSQGHVQVDDGDKARSGGCRPRLLPLNDRPAAPRVGADSYGSPAASRATLPLVMESSDAQALMQSPTAASASAVMKDTQPRAEEGGAAAPEKAHGARAASPKESHTTESEALLPGAIDGDDSAP